jgi:hypothetical protein
MWPRDRTRAPGLGRKPGGAQDDSLFTVTGGSCAKQIAYSSCRLNDALTAWKKPNKRSPLMVGGLQG